MQVGKQALGKIDKRIAKLNWEAEEKKTEVDSVAAKLEKAKVAKDEVAHQQEDLKLLLRSLLP